MKICKKTKGFTLIELMACVVILGILTTTLSFFFDGTLKLYKNENANTTIQFDARRALTSITNDVRNASKLNIGKDYDNNILPFTDKNGVNLNYTCNSQDCILQRSGKNLVEDIKSVEFIRHSSNPNILFVNITAQMKNSSVVYNICSGIKIPDGELNIVINNTPKMDLNFMENNVINVINPSFDFDLKNITINTNARNTDNERENLFFECNTFDCSDLGSNGSNLNNGDLIVKANTLNWGNNSLAIARQSKNGNNNVILDVIRTNGNANLNVIQSKNYENDSYINSNGLSLPGWNKNSAYPYDGEWRSKNLFDPSNNGSILSKGISTLNDKIDFSNSDIKEDIHYFNNSQGNEIDIRDPNNYSLNDYKGTANGSTINIKDTNGYVYSNDDYQYIICHGPLTISCPDTNNCNMNFKFRGLIYCDDVITFKNITPAFRGILISKGINAEVQSGQHQNWIGISFDDNSENGGLDKINTLINENVK